MKRLKEYRNTARGFPDELIWNMSPEEGIIKNKDGSLMAAWSFYGEDLGSCTNSEMSVISAKINQALCTLGSGWMIHCDAIRKSTTDYPDKRYFTDRTSFIIDQERCQLYKSFGIHYESIYVLTLTYLPEKIVAQKMYELMYENRNEKIGISKENRVIEKFKKQIIDFSNIFSSIFPMTRLMCTEEVDEFGKKYLTDNFLSHLEFCVSGYERRVRLPDCPMDIDALIGNYEVYNGNTLLMDGKTIIVIAIDGFPQESIPGMLHTLNEHSYEYRWSTRFQLLEPYEASAIIKKERRAWRQKVRGLKDQITNSSSGIINLDAAQMSADAEAAMSEAESGLMRFGYYTSVIVLIGEDAQKLMESANDIKKIIMNTGFGARIETINTMEAFLGSLPGHGYQNIRKPIMNTLNLADMLPTTSIWSGLKYNSNPMYPKYSPPLVICSTNGSTPFRFSLHVGDVGNSIMIGPIGSGKTTALNLLIAQHFRYKNARVFGFDRKHGAFVLTSAMGGDYYDIAGEETELSFCPLGDIETESDKIWANEYIEILLELQGFKIKSSDKNAIHEAILRLSQKATKSLTEFSAELQDIELREALQHYTLSGAMGGLLDAEKDTLKFSDFMIFEMENLSSLGEKNIVPVMIYLFRQIEKRLDGRPTFIPIDESWLQLNHPLFSSKLREWFKTWRSKNAHILLATQEPSDVLKSAIRDAVLSSCPTKILLANPDARETQKKMYEIMGCNDKEIQLISYATKKRDYYYKSPLGRRMFSFDLGPVALAFVGSSSKEDISQAKSYIAKYGEMWPSEWLRYKGLSEWADYWVNIQ